MTHTTLIIPAYNEEKNIFNTIEGVKGTVDRVIMIDNCSQDKTVFYAKKHNIIILKHIANIGKSNSMKTGVELAIKLGTNLIAFMDADGQHHPSDLKNIISEIKTKKLEMVIGARNYLKMPVTRLFGTKLLSLICKILYNKNIKDIQSGLRIFKSDIFDKLNWDSTGSSHYFADAEMTIKAIKNNVSFVEIPIKTIFKDKFKGMDIFQGLRLMLHLIIWKLVEKKNDN